MDELRVDKLRADETLRTGVAAGAAVANQPAARTSSRVREVNTNRLIFINMFDAEEQKTITKTFREQPDNLILHRSASQVNAFVLLFGV